MINPERKTALETKLTNMLTCKYPGPLTRVILSEGGKFAFLYVDGKCTARRKLSHYGKEFLRGEDVVLLETESFLEPEPC
jgi:hypothetical protein